MLLEILMKVRRIKFGNDILSLKRLKEKQSVLVMKLNSPFFNMLSKDIPKYANGIIIGLYEGVSLKKGSNIYEFLIRYGKKT